MPYTADKPVPPPSSDDLRRRIPGWGADLDPADRPAVPRERFDPGATGAHWELPEQQPQTGPRERSIEHGRLPPVFGTSVPLKGLSGAIRGLAYRRYSEGRAAHWLLLLAADRVDVLESAARSVATPRPDNPITQTGILSEPRRHGWSSRVGRGRADTGHHLIDPVIVGLPWAAAGGAAYAAIRMLRRVVGS
ncbi:MAG TPA: hypothetical protein VGE38_13625 [Nocardioides sp.]|uniref:hypothetical protein n=1 Tax=Nocardioides sp. TaxID=35761 RepID=UPI002ED84C19